MKTLLIILALMMAKYPAEPVTYEKIAIVIAVDYPADAVTVVDDSGELWQFIGAEDWEVWDRCKLSMNDNGTPDNVYDDPIVNVTYTGYLSLDEIREMIGK